MTTVGEEWRAVGRLGCFEVSSLGRIRCARTGRLKRPTRTRSGHWVVNLYANGRSCVRNVRSVVAEAFLGPRPAGSFVAHLDGTLSNNCASNLVYRALGLRTTAADGARVHACQGGKLTEPAAREIRRRARLGAATTALAREYGVSAPLISAIKYGRKWR
jgi:hypothetical protein